MNLHLAPIALLIFLLGCLAWNWVKWVRPYEKEYPTWRTVTMAAGLCFATISSIFLAVLYEHTAIAGGSIAYGQVELFCIRVGFPTALLGLVAARTGKGKVRKSVVVVSTVNLLIWYAAAMAP